MAKFVHLHVHTEYSLLDGLSNIKKLLNHVKENEMDSLAITDHGVMYGEIEFYKEAIKQGVKPILGMEGYITSGKLTDRPARGELQNFHLLLLAKNNEGYQNLMKLSSIAHLDGYYYRARFDRETLEKYSRGLICTSACPLGEVGQAIIHDEFAKAKKTVQWYSSVFGEDYYLELQRHEFGKWVEKAKEPEIKTSLIEMEDNEKKWNQGILKISRELGIPVIATNDTHYIKQEDALAQDVLVCIATGKIITDTKRMRYIDAQEFYIKSPDEMQKLFLDVPDALENTVKIAKKCNLEVKLGAWSFPKFPLPKGVTADEQLKKLAEDGLKVKVPKADKKTNERLNYELDIIIKKGYSPYFLIVRDLANWTNSQGIITNTRGSAAGSLVSYVLGITTVNPLTYYLPFERFLNPYRPSPPDIDFDVADDRRDEIIGYITKTYGKEKVAQVCTFGRMLSRAAVRDVARVLGYPYSTGDRIAKMIPPPKQGFPITITKAMDEILELRTLYNTDPNTKKVLDLAMQIEGNARHVSVHAAGVVVAPTEITDFSPVQREPSGEKIITQYEMHACEEVGLIKFDILGIRNLSILGAAVDIVKKTYGIDIDLHKIPLDDKKTFQMLAKGETMGVFQLASAGMTKYLTELKPTQIEDLMAMVALYRPGPISQIPEYIKRKHNPKLVKYLDPRMEKFLGKSYGLIVYQDDLLFCALDLAGYTWEEADKFRKAVGKKIPEEMAAQKEKFIKGVVANGQTQTFAENLWKLFEPFQSYGFNKAHAASYGMIAYQTAYMKANYPVEYMAALMTAESDDKDKVSAAINECRRMGIKVFAPDINESQVGFTIVKDKDSIGGKGIRFGLSAIKNVGEAAITAILAARSEGKFVSFADFLGKVDGRKVNKKVLESLIKVGAMANFGGRAALLSSMDSIKDKVVRPKDDDNQQGLFATGVLKKTEAATVITVSNIEEFSDDEIQSLERQLLGFSLSAKPISEIIGPLEFQSTHKIFEILGAETSTDSVRVAGVVAEVRVIVTKKTGAEMAFVKIDDGTGTIEVVVFPKIFKETRDFWAEGQPLLISGRIDTRDEIPALIAESIETMTSLNEKKNREVFIKISKNTEINSLRRLKTLLTDRLGEETAFLMFEGGKKVRLPFKIAWNETLAKEISDILESKPS
ncbi:MAG: DNA polymerase III subunit alpha [Candidatus Microgenomates bacterium]|jgi:DNA polymerase-3 subunit alpha